MSLDSTHQFNIPTPARVGEIFKNPSPIDRSIGGDGDDGGLIDPFFILPLPSSPYTYASPPSLASIKLINHTWLTPILQPPGFFFFFFDRRPSSLALPRTSRLESCRPSLLGRMMRIERELGYSLKLRANSLRVLSMLHLFYFRQNPWIPFTIDSIHTTVPRQQVHNTSGPSPADWFTGSCGLVCLTTGLVCMENDIMISSTSYLLIRV